ncbi:MAG: type II toxin-antitoxin system death-on-curing family toxin [Solirubrobacterales bacterium]
MGFEYLDLGDYLLIAEAILDVPAEELARLDRIGLASSALAAPQAGWGENDVYPDFAMQAAILCHRLTKNHPLPDGNKRAAFLALIEFVERNGGSWNRSDDDPDETDVVIRGVADDTVNINELRAWIERRFRLPE